MVWLKSLISAYNNALRQVGRQNITTYPPFTQKKAITHWKMSDSHGIYISFEISVSYIRTSGKRHFHP
ncbi:MAG: hypothetical protein PHO45_07990, partial [Victivallaceae bacterium]|nr:hypothetical protein [Victivallaceae bacterium]